MEKYDAIACAYEEFNGDRGEYAKQLLPLLREITDEEKASAMKAGVGPLKFWVRIFCTGPGGWPDSLCIKANLPQLAPLPAFCRCYRQSAEFVPGDFTWVKLDGFKDAWGGTLNDPTKRL